MELNTQEIEELLSKEELEEVKSYFEANKSGIVKELSALDQHIALRPLAVVFREPNEELHNRYQSLSFMEEVKEDGSKGVYVEFVK
ncbi:hypothetical protein AC739_17170 [Planococcus glaciei]|uniref:Uncharacterized protein n=1 Tax=Planococcus glaciei TaxID=459472 RepID=A0A7H8Q7P2_9BACL|nr:hypothetical protein [Planococcus glaciei]KOF09000.1 hypothetical protein AC739_17170 [Planococcus glaciei]QDY44818.1 hypothetical protein FK545_02705 [Planococcus glaciei]QKX49535.1 hypothetical protein HF394_02480 [Planococcus glaciei]